MNTNVPSSTQACACPSASHEGLVALLELLPHRHRPGIRALLSGPDLKQPNWGHIYLREEWFASVLGLLGLGPSWIRPSEPIPIHIGVEHDARLGPRLVISACDWPTPAQVAADAELRRNLEEQGRWRPGRAPNQLRQLFVLTPKGGGLRWETLAPGLCELHECRIVHLAEREVDLDDADAVHEALRDAADYVHWAGADAVLIVTGDRRIGARALSDPRVVEAACDLGAPVLTLSGPVPTLLDALAWRSSPIPSVLQAAVEEILRGELARADRARLDRMAEVLNRPRNTSSGQDWPSDAPF